MGEGRRPVGAVLLVFAVAGLGACAVSSTASAERYARERLDAAAATVHERALRHRAADPAAFGPGAGADLALALTGGDATRPTATHVGRDRLSVVTAVGVVAHAGGGLTYEQVVVGACLETTVTTATVRTVAVPCPDGVAPTAEGGAVETTTTRLRSRESPVPPPVTPCRSGSGECGGGG